ncbi:MAG: hypothetical protein ACTS5I_14500 [Rhodanobacter sp.]
MIKALLLTAILCIVSTFVVWHGPLSASAAGESIAVALVWLLGLAWVVWTFVRRHLATKRQNWIAFAFRSRVDPRQR